MAKPEPATDLRLQMCEENLHEGMSLGPIFYMVSAEQATAFASAIGLADYKAEPGAPVPATMRLQDYALLISKHFRGGSGGVHARQRTEFHRPLCVGQSITAAGVIARTYHKRGKFYFELEYEARDASSNELLTRQTITSVLLRNGGISSEAT